METLSGHQRPVYPFTAIVGQEALKKALLLNAVDPSLSGVLIRGEKGTGKSTAVRALAALLPEIDVVADCPFSCDPDDPSAQCDACRERSARGEELPRRRRRMKLVELPVSASEDRVVGTLSLEEAVRHGERRFQPGLLAEANRGILYIDEVNLLDDHLVDVLLDAAASGVNHVEREGVSHTHPARFILVGTMNPEEGDLRPQLLDRFGLVVDVEGIADPAQRAEIVRRRLAFEDDPAGFAAAWRAEEERLGRAIAAARALLPRVEVPDDLLHLIATVALAMGVDGHRADIVMYKAARANAALEGRRRATDGDVLEAAALVLPHRMRRRPFEEASYDRSRVEEIVARFRAGEAPAPGVAGAAPGV